MPLKGLECHHCMELMSPNHVPHFSFVAIAVKRNQSRSVLRYMLRIPENVKPSLLLRVVDHHLRIPWVLSSPAFSYS